MMRQAAGPMFLAAALVAALAGCAGGPRDDAAMPPASPANTDPCAMRLHDLSGGLLLHLFKHGQLPDALDELSSQDAGPPMPPASCPASGEAYTYAPNGILLPERGQRVVLHDATASHDGFRWAILLTDATGDEAVVMRVVALPESFFALRSK